VASSAVVGLTVRAFIGAPLRPTHEAGKYQEHPDDQESVPEFLLIGVLWISIPQEKEDAAWDEAPDTGHQP